MNLGESNSFQLQDIYSSNETTAHKSAILSFYQVVVFVTDWEVGQLSKHYEAVKSELQ